jgi:hypothetical protein
MPNLKIKCGCETEPDIKVMVLTGVVPIAQIVCQNCEWVYLSIGGEVVNA